MTSDGTSLQQRLDLEVLCERYHIVGAVVGVSVRGRRTVLVRGMANSATGAPLSRETFMLAGSVTKAMTASIVSLLRADGVVDIDAPLVEYLPRFRVADRAATPMITPRHLLSHMAGFDGDIWEDLAEGGGALESLVQRVASCPQQTTPGTAFSYNNAAYGLLGAMIQSVTGDSFEHALRERISSRCGAEITTELSVIDAATTAVGHVEDAGGVQIPVGTVVGPACLTPAGSRTWTTIDGLLSFGELHLGRHGTPHEHAALVAMRAPQCFINDPNNGGTMGLGVFLDERWGTPVVFHDGGVNGQSAYLRILPEFDTVLAIMSTGGVPQVFHRHVFAGLSSAFPGVAAPLGVTADPGRVVDVDRYVGRFRSSSTVVDVTEVEQGLAVEVTWGLGTPDAVATGALPLAAVDDEIFIAPLGGRDYVLVFPPPDQPVDHVLAGLRRLDRVS